MPAKNSSFVVCIRNSGYPASLQLGRVYQKISDRAAQNEGFVRVVDESGEDYLYPEKMFVRVTVPKSEMPAVKRAVANAH